MVAVLRRAPARPPPEPSCAAPEPSVAEARVDEKPLEAPAETYAAAKWLICTILGVLLCFSFGAALQQNAALLGADGLAPCADYVRRKREAQGIGGVGRGFFAWPCLWWWVEPTDASLDAVAAAGLGAAALVAAGLHLSPLLGVCWLCHASIVAAAEASSFYSYGWETQLLETCFLAMFLCSPTAPRAHPTRSVLWLFRWLMCDPPCRNLGETKSVLADSCGVGSATFVPKRARMHVCRFRISIGAGLIKTRGGSCWAKKVAVRAGTERHGSRRRRGHDVDIPWRRIVRDGRFPSAGRRAHGRFPRRRASGTISRRSPCRRRRASSSTFCQDRC